MANNHYVTNKDIHEAIENLRLEIKRDIKDIRACVDENTSWRNRIVGQFTIIMVIVGAAINWIFSQFNK